MLTQAIQAVVEQLKEGKITNNQAFDELVIFGLSKEEIEYTLSSVSVSLT